jgi:8-oxo-dGTP diphosphatase
MNESGILIAEQFYRNRLLRKFPGGGLEYGEGLIEGLKREFMEELNLEIEVISHYYTTDFFVQSIFRKQEQVISVYYKVKPAGGWDFPLPEYTRLPAAEGEEFFRWIPFESLLKEEFMLPIESHVAAMLYNDHKKTADR